LIQEEEEEEEEELEDEERTGEVEAASVEPSKKEKAHCKPKNRGKREDQEMDKQR
jgi:hypothetical protein